MRRAARTALFVLPWLLLAMLLWDTFGRIGFIAADEGSRAHQSARDAFYADLANQGCVPREAVVEHAQARGWAWSALDAPLWCHRPELSDWLAVQVEPPLPFSTDDENAAFIGFDESGCMARWENSACE